MLARHRHERLHGPRKQRVLGLRASFNEDTTLTASRAVNPTLDASFLANIDILVLDRLQRAPTEEEVNALEAWGRAGHGVIAFGGFGGVDHAQAFLTPFGITRGSASLGGGSAGTRPTRVFWHNALLWAGGRL